jgi:hypothetical protein
VTFLEKSGTIEDEYINHWISIKIRSINESQAS